MKTAYLSYADFKADPGAAFALARTSSCVVVQSDDKKTVGVISVQHNTLRLAGDNRQRKRRVANNRRTR